MLTLLSLYSDFIAYLVLASVLSLFAGWMIGRSTAKKQMAAATKIWENKIQELEEAAVVDTDNLEEQLQNLAGDTRTLKATNRVLTESLKKNDATIQKARAEAIELNRQNAETQERLQRVIQQKEREIIDTSNRLKPQRRPNVDDTQKLGGLTYNAAKTANLTNSALNIAFDDDLDDDFEVTLSESVVTGFEELTLSTDEAAINNADTIAINPSDLLDATLQMSADDFIHQQNQLPLPADSELGAAIENTVDVTGVIVDEIEEPTVALDDDSLAFAKRPFPLSNVD